MMSTETFWLIEVPGGDRRYIERHMTPDRYKHLKEAKEGTRILKVVVGIPDVYGKTEDVVLARAYLSVSRIPVASVVDEPFEESKP